VRPLVVMAHFDPRGQVAPHVLRQLEAWQGVAQRVLLVTTATIAADAEGDAVRAQVAERGAELVERANYGYDFYSYKVGLDLVADKDEFDLVVICNDSYVGPLVPYRHVLDTMADHPVDAWGLTETMRRARHVQSYFYAFRPWVVRSQAFTRFWSAMTPESDRMKVITKYEIGLSKAVLGGGFEIGSYFRENDDDRRVARRRHLWWAAHRIPQQPKGSKIKALKRFPFEPWNPMAALADRALQDARLPIVKLDTLRYDPYQLGADWLLTACEQRYPREFAGVREFIERTSGTYTGRAGENRAPTARPPWPAGALVGYQGAAR
jgi:hypothetical protein